VSVSLAVPSGIARSRSKHAPSLTRVPFKALFAAAVAGGFLLLGAPAHADALPVPVGALSGSLPMANGGLPVIGGLLGGGGVLGGGALLGGLPAGGLQPGNIQPGSRMPVGQGEAGPTRPGLPLLDGFAGALPGPATPQLTKPAIDPSDVSGMPPGGVPIIPAGDEAPNQPAEPTQVAEPTQPATAADPDGQATDADPGDATGPGTGSGAGASTGATDDYNRLHEEPIDDEATQRTDTWPFSPVGRPVAGVDPGVK